MSKQENNLTKAEKSVLKGLNIRANLILQVEEIFMDAKIPIDKNLLLVSRDVIYTNLENILTADVMEVEIDTKNTKIFMHEEKKKVNIKSK